MKIEMIPAMKDSGVTGLTLKAENDEDEKVIMNMFDKCSSVCQCELDCGQSPNDGRFCELKFIIKPQRTLVLTKDGEYEEVFSLLNRSNLLWNPDKCLCGVAYENDNDFKTKNN